MAPVSDGKIVTTLFDRYLIGRFLHVVLIGYFATFGLYVVIDGFTNVDNFQERVPDGDAMKILASMAEHYTYQSSLFLGLVGPILTVLGVMVVLFNLQRNSELYPILAAGIPTYRLAVPLLIGAIGVNALLVLNQELIIPRIVHQLQKPRGMDESSGQNVESIYDHKTRILIAGKKLFFADRKMNEAEFTLPYPFVAGEFTTLKAPEAYFRQGNDQQPTGWLLKNVQPRFDGLKLSPHGQGIVRSVENADDVFVVTDVSFDQLNNRDFTYRLLSTPQLMKRIRNPSYSPISARNKTLHLHERLTGPLTNLIAVLMAVPLVVRKEGSGLVTNMATAAGILGLIFALNQSCLYLGKANLIGSDLAVWIPVIVTGTLASWMSGLVQT